MDAPQSTVWVESWADPHTEATGVEVRAPYVERYWTSVLGPTQVMLLRIVADELEESPDGFEMCLVDTSLRLGVSPNKGGKGAARAFERLEMFRMAARGHSLWAVRRSVPVLSPPQLDRLPEGLRVTHGADAEASAAVWDDAAATRAVRVALGLAGAGEPQAVISRHLLSLRYPPSVCDEAAKLAVESVVQARNESARAAAGAEDRLSSHKSPVMADVIGL